MARPPGAARGRGAQTSPCCSRNSRTLTASDGVSSSTERLRNLQPWGYSKGCLDTTRSNRLWGTLLEQEVGLNDSCAFFQPEPLHKPKQIRKITFSSRRWDFLKPWVLSCSSQSSEPWHCYKPSSVLITGLRFLWVMHKQPDGNREHPVCCV